MAVKASPRFNSKSPVQLKKANNKQPLSDEAMKLLNSCYFKFFKTVVILNLLR